MYMNEDFNFKRSDLLNEFFAEEYITSEDVNIMDYYAFGHELGHLFGLILAELSGYKLATANYIIIEKKEQKIFTERDDFKPLNKTYSCFDLYNEKNMCYDEDDEKRLSSKLNDINKSLYYFSYLLLGGIFHLSIYSDKPTTEHFDYCYTDDELNIDYNGIYGRAGNDWSKLKRLASLKQWKLVELKNLRSDIYHFLQSTQIFVHLKPKIVGLYQELKIKQKIEGYDLIKIEGKLKEIFIELPEFAPNYHYMIIQKYFRILEHQKF